MKITEVNYKWHSGLASRSKTDYIALHHAEAVRCSAADIHSWHLANGWAGIGYHFLVRKDGSVYRGRPIWAVGAHVLGKNDCSVGICAEGDYQTRDKTMPEAQKKAIKELLKYLKEIYPNAKIVGHREIGDSNCPGRYYPLDEMKNYESEVKEMKKFTDISGHYAEEHIEKLGRMGIANGDKNGHFRPDAPATRADVAIMVANAVRYITGK